jgi:mono/diheme cytochrome c family protein
MKDMRMYLMLVFAVAIMSSVASAQSKTWLAPDDANAIINPLAKLEDATKKGKKLYNQLCSICHGDKGKGDGMAGAALTPKPANFTLAKVQTQTDGAIYWKITEGRAPMAAYKDILKEEERWQLVNYIRTFKQ